MTTATRELARIEASRMLRHPAPWIGVALTGLMTWSVWEESWSGQRYHGMAASITPLLLGISLASVSAFGRELVAVAEEAPVDRSTRSVARLAGGLPLVVLAAVIVVVGAVWLRSTGGMTLGEEPGHTDHAHYTLPELVQLVLLAGFAVALGAAVVHVLRHRIAAAVLLALGWFLVGPTYWILNGPVLRLLTPLQLQPVTVEIGPVDADPSRFPSTWLLTAPGEYQDHWARVVVSPAMAWSHAVYLLGLIALAVAVAVPGPTRRPFLAGGAVLAVVGVTLQVVVAP